MATTFESTTYERTSAETGATRWTQWPVYWGPIWVGALASICALLVLGLVSAALGLQVAGVARWSDFKVGALIASVLTAFLSFVIGGWVAGKIAGILLSETAMLHGAIVWLVAVPILLALATHGAASYFGGWYGGLAGQPAAVAAADNFTRTGTVNAADLEQERAREARNSALGTVTALLLGLVGAVIGGWMASGEPMTFTHYRTRSNGRAAHSRL